MTRFLVTADVHLTPDHPERLAALEEVVDVAGSEDADFLLVAGDLFDGGADVEEVKPEVRRLFSDNAFHSFVLPGNHDAEAYRDEDYFGDDVSVLRERPLEAVDIDGVRMIALPYTEDGFGQLVDEVRGLCSSDRTNLLLLHGTLSTEKGGGFGGESRYMPFTPEQLLESGVDLVFAGHVHSEATRRGFGDGAVEFHYPGSPVSVTEKETGRRSVWLYNSTEDEVRGVDLSSFHYVVEQVEVSPGEEDVEIESLRRRLQGRALDGAEVVVEARGYVEGSPGEFYRRVEDAVAEAGAESHRLDRGEVANAAEVVDTDLYREFDEKLESRDMDVDEEDVRSLFLRAMSQEERV